MRSTQRILHASEERHLAIRIFISRTTRTITQKAIADGYGMSIPTLRRYYSPEYRALSQKLAADQYRRYKANMTIGCQFCGEDLERHSRCQACDVLLHDVETDRNGGTPDMTHCHSCIKALNRIIIREYGLA